MSQLSLDTVDVAVMMPASGAMWASTRHVWAIPAVLADQASLWAVLNLWCAFFFMVYGDYDKVVMGAAVGGWLAWIA